MNFAGQLSGAPKLQFQPSAFPNTIEDSINSLYFVPILDCNTYSVNLNEMYLNVFVENERYQTFCLMCTPFDTEFVHDGEVDETGKRLKGIEFDISPNQSLQTQTLNQFYDSLFKYSLEGCSHLNSCLEIRFGLF